MQTHIQCRAQMQDAPRPRPMVAAQAVQTLGSCTHRASQGPLSRTPSAGVYIRRLSPQKAGKLWEGREGTEAQHRGHCSGNPLRGSHACARDASELAKKSRVRNVLIPQRTPFTVKFLKVYIVPASRMAPHSPSSRLLNILKFFRKPLH